MSGLKILLVINLITSDKICIECESVALNISENLLLFCYANYKGRMHIHRTKYEEH